MISTDILGKKGAQVFKQFSTSYQLNAHQQQQFLSYYTLLQSWNKDINLTALTEPGSIVTHHFQDSLEVSKMPYFEYAQMIADVGSGAGFPGIPLKIFAPEKKVILIEVTGKKIAFLRTVIEFLGLQDIEIYTLDWRTFLRKTEYPIDLFVSKASLQPEELARMFKPSSPYKDKALLYFASKDWICPEEIKQFNADGLCDLVYRAGNRERRMAFFAKGKPTDKKV